MRARDRAVARSRAFGRSSSITIFPALPVLLALVAGCAGSGTPPVREVSRVQTTAASTAGYRVVRGDTLYSIAWRHQRDFRELAALNGIRAPYSIYPGQVLRVRGKPVRRSAVPPARSAAVVAKPKTTADKPRPHPLASTQPKPSVPSAAAASAPAPSAATNNRSAVRSQAPKPKAALRLHWPGAGKRLRSFGATTSKSAGPSNSIEMLLNEGSEIRSAGSGEVVYVGRSLAGYGQFVIVKHNDSWLSAYGFNAPARVKEGQRLRAGSTLAVVGATSALALPGEVQPGRLHFEVRKNGAPVNPDGVIGKPLSG